MQRQANPQQLPTELLALVEAELKKTFFTDGAKAFKIQVGYMRHNVIMPDPERTPEDRESAVQKFGDRLKHVNRLLKYFPRKPDGSDPQPLPDDEIRDILHRSIPPEWHMEELGSNIDVDLMSWEQLITYYKKLEHKCTLENTWSAMPVTVKETGKGKKKRPASATETESGHPPSKRRKTPKECIHCGKMALHLPDNCRENPKNKGKYVSFKKEAKGKFSHGEPWKSKEDNNKPLFTMNQMMAMTNNFSLSKGKAARKRKVSKDDKSQEEKAYLASLGSASYPSDNDSESGEESE